MQFEASENKVAVVGYGAAAVVAILTAEWLIHLPGLNVVRIIFMELAAPVLP
jgi:hypothetical protein